MTQRKRVTAAKPWLMLKHRAGSDYGSTAYTLHTLTGQTIIIHGGLTRAQADLIERAPVLEGRIMKTLGALGTIIGHVARIDRDSKANERTDIDDVWITLYAIKGEAQATLKLLRKGAR